MKDQTTDYVISVEKKYMGMEEHAKIAQKKQQEIFQKRIKMRFGKIKTKYYSKNKKGILAYVETRKVFIVTH